MPTLITLVGMPGSGKSTIGKHLARRSGRAFADSDTVIERRVGGSIREFFEREGEPRFRDLEAEALRDLVGSEQGVLATGGGIVLRPDNRNLLRTRTICIYLRSRPEDLMRRLRHDTKRPLLQVAEPLARLRELHAERDPLYCEAARIVVDTGRPSVAALVDAIMAELGLAAATGTEAEIDPHSDEGVDPALRTLPSQG